MLRTIGGVIVGYLVIAILVIGTTLGLYAALGLDRVFMPERYDPSPTWITAMIISGFIAAMIGGAIARSIGRSQTAPRALAVVTLLLGALAALPALSPASDPRPNVRLGDVPIMEAMSNARQPVWVALLLPVIGVAGVLYGGRQR